MTLTLKNSYTRDLERFIPLDPAARTVTIYSCGPTVYSYAHIGNFRSFLIADVLHRVLERRGYAVRQVMNITDVGHMTEDHLADAHGEDKLAKAARELGQDPIVVARHFEAAFVADAKSLRLALYSGDDVQDARLHPRATEHIPEMLGLIQRLLEADYAYCDSQGQVYFRVERFPEYGRLSGKDIDELDAGARVAVREEKHDPRDFALWKVDSKHLMQWDPQSPAGWAPSEWERFRALVPTIDPRIRAGFPGWHIECSAMADANLGATIDIHTGGEDNIFPHHECEIAQSFGALQTTVPGPEGASDAGQPRPCFARYWIHGRHLLVDGRKMSKRDGTFFTVRDLFDPTAAGKPELAKTLLNLGFTDGRVPANVLRYALIANPYTQPMNFTFEALGQARASIERFQSRVDRLREIELGKRTDTMARPEIASLLHEGEQGFDAALDNNLNMPQALAELFGVVTKLNQLDASLSSADATAALATLRGMDHVLDVLERNARSGFVSSAELTSTAADAASFDLASLGDATLEETQIVAAIALRQAAKREKRFADADAIRRTLSERGITIEDAPAGVRWKR